MDKCHRKWPVIIRINVTGINSFTRVYFSFVFLQGVQEDQRKWRGESMLLQKRENRIQKRSSGCRFSITGRHTRIILATLQENTTVWNTVFFLFSPQLTLYLGKRDYVDNVSVVDKVGTFLLCAHTERMLTKYRYNNITTTLLPAEGVVKLDPKDFGDRKGNNNNILPSWSIRCYKPSAWRNGSVLFALSVCAAGVCLPLR